MYPCLVWNTPQLLHHDLHHQFQMNVLWHGDGDVGHCAVQWVLTLSNVRSSNCLEFRNICVTICAVPCLCSCSDWVVGSGEIDAGKHMQLGVVSQLA